MEEVIIHDEKIIALIIRAGVSVSGVKFFTPSEFSQQLGIMNHKRGRIIQPHTHNKVRREVVVTQEVLIIRKGKMRVLLYTEDRQFLRSVILKTGDVILLASGGHGFEMLENTEMVEVKQGPYMDTMMDKTKFEFHPVNNERP